MRHVRRRSAAAAVTATAMVMWAAGALGTASPIASAATTHACGTYQLGNAPDPDNVLGQLPTIQRDAYIGDTIPVYKSQWVHWKPAGKPPYKIGIDWGPQSPWSDAVAAALEKALKKTGVVSAIDFRSDSATVNVPLQISNFDALIAEKVTAIVVLPIATQALLPEIQKAAAAGIPTISMQSAVDSAGAVGVVPNTELAGAQMDAQLLKLIHGQGNILEVNGIPGVQTDINAQQAYQAALKNCPNATVLGSVVGDFDNSAAKAAVLEFLATHPQPIAGVMQSGAMTQGIMSAFAQLGRPMPIVVDAGPEEGSLGYWITHKTTYHGIGDGIPVNAFATATATVLSRMLKGNDPTISTIETAMPLITASNLGDWANKSWALSNSAQALGPATSNFLSNTYLRAFFAKKS